MLFKDVVQHFAVFVGGLLIVYLLTALVAFDLNPADWDELARLVHVVLTGGWFVVYADAVKE